MILVVLAVQLPDVSPGRLPDRREIENVLRITCSFNSVSRPNSIGDFVSALPAEVNALARKEQLTPVPIYVDEPALMRNGIDLYGSTSWGFSLRVEDISLRSSLRFILDAYGVSYFVGEGQVVVTTKPIARAIWMSQLDQPDPALLLSGTLDERRATAFAAGFWSIDPAEWIAPLANSLDDTDRQLVFDATFALGELGPTAKLAIEPIIDNLRSSDEAIREASVVALARIGPSAIDTLLKQVNDPSSPIATAAVRSLGLMGRAGKEAVPALTKIGSSSNDVVLRGWLSNTLVLLDPIGSLADARKRLHDESPGTRVFAVETISDVERLRLDRLATPNLKDVVREILGLLHDRNTDVRRAAASALWRIELPVDTPIAPLESALNDADNEVRNHARSALHLLKNAKATHAAER